MVARASTNLTRLGFVNIFSQKEGHTSATLFVKGDLKSFGYSLLPRVVQSSQKQNESLLISRWIAFAKYLDDRTVKVLNFYVVSKACSLTRS